MNNKGFSLIELIITVAILTIITSAILGFIVTGTKSYGNVNEEVELQQEAQLTFNQLSDLIIDSTNGIKYYYNDNENKIILTDSDITETVTSKTLAIYNTVKEAGVEKKYIYNIIWKKSENKLYLRKDTIAATGAVTKGTPELMAEYVNDFSPSLAKAQNKKKVVIELSFIKNNKSYVSKKNFALRNKAVVNGTITDIFDNMLGTMSSVSDVEITKDNQVVSQVTIWKNLGTINFGSKVTGVGFPSNDVTWNLSGSTSSVNGEESGTSVANTSTGCIVTIGRNEASGSLSLTATSKALGADGSPVTSNPVNIVIKEITGINLAVSDHSGEYRTGDTFTVTATVNGSNSLTVDEKKVIWSVSGATRDVTIPEDSLVQKFRVTANYGEKVNVTAKSKIDENIYAMIPEITVSKVEYKVKIVTDIDTICPYNGNDAKTTITASITPNDSTQHKVVWTIDKCYQWNIWDPNGQYYTEWKESNGHIMLSSNGNSATFEAKSWVTWTDFKVTITAYLEDNQDVKDSIDIYINKKH